MLTVPGCTDALDAVTAALWHERACMDRLLFRLIAQQLILMSAHTRWLHLADDEVRGAADALADAEASRSVEFGLLAQLAELPTGMTLGELATAAPEPWPLLLEEHLVALRELAREIRVISKGNADLLRAGERAIRETLDALPPTPRR